MKEHLREFPGFISLGENHLYLAPHPLLKPYIAHYTLSFPSLSVQEQTSDFLTLIPDASGCIVCTFDGDRMEGLFWGPTTKTVTVENDVNDIPLRFFIEFLPCGAHQLLGINIAELRDLRISLELFSRPLFDEIERLFLQSDGIKPFISGVNRLFINALSRLELPYNETLIVPMLKQYDGLRSAQALSEESFYSIRQLNRVCEAALGMSLKSYARLLRINRALLLIGGGSPLPLTGIAQQLGYYDQPHFNHDFKTVCGVSPTDYQKRMSEFYNENYKF